MTGAQEFAGAWHPAGVQRHVLAWACAKSTCASAGRMQASKKPFDKHGKRLRQCRAQHDAKKVAEMGTGLYGAYKMGRAAYPYIRAGLAAL